MVGIPFISEQPKNIRNLVRWGAAVRLNKEDLTADALKNAIIEVATNRRLVMNKVAIICL